MNNDLISREALLDAMCKTCTMQEACEKSYNETRDFIQAIPAVDAEPVRHGRWEQYPGPSDIRCTYCKVEFDKSKMPLARNYCPNCGAKMDGGVNK